MRQGSAVLLFTGALLVVRGVLHFPRRLVDDPRNRLLAAEHLCIGAASGALGAAMLVASFFTDSGRVAVVLAAAVVATAALVAHLTVVTRTASNRTADEWDLLVIDRSHQVRISATVGAVALLTLAAAM